jgi:hypothetical protein
MIECKAFYDCGALSQLTFELDSRMKDLDLPPADFGSVLVPNSAEAAAGVIRRLGTRSRVLHFGLEWRINLSSLAYFRSVFTSSGQDY